MKDTKVVPGTDAKGTSQAETAETEISGEVKTPAETRMEALEETSNGLLGNLEAVLATSKSRRGGGASVINPAVGYQLVPEKVNALVGTSIQPQAQLIFRLINKHSTKDRPFVPEPEMVLLLEAAAKSGTLKTKQKPFDVFRYYRSVYGKQGAIKAITIAPAVPAASAA